MSGERLVENMKFGQVIQLAFGFVVGAVESKLRINVALSGGGGRAILTAALYLAIAVVGPLNAQTVAESSVCYDNPQNFANPTVYYWNPQPDTANIADVTWPGIELQV